MSDIPRLNAEVRCKVAEAKLSVAEDFGWLVAILTAFVVYLILETWIGSLASAIFIYFLVTHQFKKEHDKAWEDYERLTGTGRYYSGIKDDNNA